VSHRPPSGFQNVEGSGCPRPDAGRVGDPGGDARPGVGEIGERLAVAVIVHGEGGIAQPGETRRDLLGVLGEARSFMADQHARPLPGLAVVDDVLANQARAIRPVLDVLCMHVPSLRPRRTLAKSA